MADIVKIYEIKMQGQKQVLDDSKKVLTSFDDLKKKWIDLKKTMTSDKLSTADVVNYGKEVRQLTSDYANLQKQIEKTGNTKRAVENSSSSARPTNAGQISTNNIGSGVTNNLNANLQSIQNMTQFTEAFIRSQNEQTAATKRLQSAQTSLAVEESATGKEIATVKMQTANARKQNRAAAEAELVIQSRINKLSESEKQRLAATVSLYSKVEMKMRTLQNEYKGLATAKQLGIKLTDDETKRMDFLAGKIDKYDTALKAVDGSMGRYQRNVGNYASGFNSLNMSVAQLTREAPAFANSMQTGFMAISNNLPIFFDSLKQIREQNKAMAAEGKPTTSVLKQLGAAFFSWNTLLSVGVVLLTVYGKDMVEWTKKMLAGSSAAASLKKNIQDLNAAKKEGAKSAASEISQLDKLYKVSNNAALSYEQRMRAVRKLQDLYPSFFANLSAEIIMTGKAKDRYVELRNAILDSARARAIGDKLAERQSKQLEDEEEIQNRLNDLTRERNKLKKNPNYTETELVRDGYGDKGLVSQTVSNNELLSRNENQYNGYYQRLLKMRKDFNKQNEFLINEQTRIEGKKSVAAYDSDKYGKDAPKAKKPKEYTGAKLTGEQNDAIDLANAWRDNELAKAKEQKLKLQITEEDYWKKYIEIYQTYRNKVESILKGSNAKEQSISAATRKKAVDELEKATDEIYNLQKKSFDKQLKLAEQTAKDKLDNVVNDPYSSEQQKLDAENVFHEESTTAQIEYNQKMIDLENELSKRMVDEANQRNADLKQKLDEENRNSLEYKIKKIRVDFDIVDNVKEDVINQNEINKALQETSLIKDKNLNQDRKKIELERIAKELILNNINAELAGIISKISRYDEELKKRKLTNDELREYNKLIKEKAVLESQKANAENDLSISGFNIPMPGSGTSGLASSITNKLKDSRGIISIGKDKNGADIDGSEMIGEVIAQSFDLANQAMNTYFDAEKQRVEQSKQLAYERIDLEKEQLMRFAQSQAEKDSLEKQAAEKKKIADKEAGKQLKKIKKQELKLALATELANIAVAAASNPLNGVTLGAAGIAMYAALSLLAIGRYAINSKAVDSAQYGRGGKMKKWFGLGGRLDNGTYHSENNGMPIINPKTNEVEAYIEKEEGIINKNSMRDKNVYSVTGTPSQIASKINAVGGGVDWHGGATMKKFLNGGPYLGSRLQPPVFRSYYENSNSGNNDNSTDFSEVKQMIADLAELQKRESMKKTYVSQREMSNAQNEYNKQSEIATL